MKHLLLPFLLLFLFTNCTPKQSEKTETETETEKAWTNLLINNSLEGWHIFQDDGSKKGWIVEDDILIFNGISDMESGTGDASLLSDKRYRNFEIQFEWKLEAGGNSGFMWGVREDEKYKYPYQTGQEIQILDAAIYNDPESVLGGEIELKNVMDDLEERKHFVGALYDLFAPTVLDASKPAEQWNSYHIKIDYTANRGEVIFNDISVNVFPLKGPEWKARFEKSKFNKPEENEYLGDARWYDFAKFEEGHICLQDHPGKVSYRNIRIRELE